MTNRMPLYGGDHSIMVTAEFWENGYLLKNGGSSIRRVEIDLITRDDITLDQFLEALINGIHQRLEKRYGVTPTKEEAELLYWDENFGYQGRGLDEPQEFSDSDTSPLSREQRALRDWLLCWHLYHVCADEYRGGYEETRDRNRAAVFTDPLERHPVISCGSIDSRVLPKQDAARLIHASQYWLDQQNHGGKLLRELGFVNSTRIIFDPAMWHRADSLFGDTLSEYKVQKLSPIYRVGDRPKEVFDDTPIRVLPPENTKQPLQLYLVPMIVAPAVMIAVFAGIWFLGGQSAMPDRIYPYILGTILAIAAIGLVGWGASRQAAKVWIKMQCLDYQKYIRQTIGQIRSRQNANAAVMRRENPPVLDPILRLDLVHMANSVSSELFSRIPGGTAFLQVRLGVSKPDTLLVPSSFQIIGTPADTAFDSIRYTNIRHTTVTPFTVLPPAGLLSKNQVLSGKEKFLFDLPKDIEATYSHLDDAPVMLDIGKSRAVGILTADEDVSIRPFLSNLLLDLCFHHSPEDLQVVMLFEAVRDEREQQERIRYFKHLPHFRKLLPERSAFAFGIRQANETMNQVYDLLRIRRNAVEKKGPHILLVAEDSDWVKYHALSNYLPGSTEDTRDNPDGITFLTYARYRRGLPPYCSSVVKVTHEKEWYLLPHQQIVDGTDERRYAFQPDTLPYRQNDSATVDEKDIYFRAFKTISALSCLKFGQTENLPMTGMMELLGAYGQQYGQHFDFFPDESIPLNQRRELIAGELKRYQTYMQDMTGRNVTASLAVPVGFDYTGVTTIDLNVTEMGSNLLVLSDNSAGRTSFLLTYLRSLCIHYSHEEVQVILADFNADGLRRALHDERYVMRGFVACNDQGAEVLTVMEAFLNAVKRYLSHRKELYEYLGIYNHSNDGLRLYNQYIKDLKYHAVERLHLDGERLEMWLAKNDGTGIHSHLPHLFVVLDDLDDWLGEMDRQDAVKLLKALAWIMKEGVQFGMHFIVSALTVEYMEAEDMLDLFQSRICFKHSCMDEAEACVGVTLPAQPFFPYDGRAYLYSTENRSQAYCQISYSADNPIEKFVPEASLTYAPPEGPYESLDGEKLESASERANKRRKFRWQDEKPIPPDPPEPIPPDPPKPIPPDPPKPIPPDPPKPIPSDPPKPIPSDPPRPDPYEAYDMVLDSDTERREEQNTEYDPYEAYGMVRDSDTERREKQNTEYDPYKAYGMVRDRDPDLN